MTTRKDRVSLLGYAVVLLWLGLAIWLRDSWHQPTPTGEGVASTPTLPVRAQADR